MGAHDVVLGKLEGIAKGIVNMRLCREMHDRVDFFRSEHIGDQLAAADVPFHEFVIGIVFDFI